MAGEDELSKFRKRWKHELEKKTEVKNVGYFGHRSEADGADGQGSGHAGESGKKPGGAEGSTRLKEDCKDQPQYVSIAEGLLDGRSSPLLARMEEERMRRKRRCERGDGEQQQQHLSAVQTQRRAHLTLIDQFIQDLVGSRHLKLLLSGSFSYVWVSFSSYTPAHNPPQNLKLTLQFNDSPILIVIILIIRIRIMIMLMIYLR